MSHFTKIDRANIIDAQAFVDACKSLGFVSVQTNVEIIDYYGHKEKVDVAIKCGKYDIALKKNSNGTYDMIADWWAIRREELPEKLQVSSDKELQDILLKYTTAHTVASKYRRQGYRVNMFEDNEQNLQIELNKF